MQILVKEKEKKKTIEKRKHGSTIYWKKIIYEWNNRDVNAIFDE